MKKALLLLMTLALIAGAFSGCGKNEHVESGEIAPKSDLTEEKIGYYGDLKLPIDMDYTEIRMCCDTAVTTNNDSVVIKELRRRTGINLQIEAIPRATYQEKMKLYLASKNNMPDIFNGGVSLEEATKYGQQGAFETISDHYDELPNLKEIFFDKADEYGTEGKIRNVLSGDGKLYIFPAYDVNRDVNHGFLYRKDIFDANGIKMWSNPEEFLDALRTLKKLYPESTPFASKTGLYIFRDFSYNWGLNGFDPYYDEETGKWKISPTDPKFKTVLDFLKTMFDEGLIDPEFITATQLSWTSKMTQADKAFVTWDWIGRLDQFKLQTEETVPDYDLRYAEPLNGKVVTLPRAFASGTAVTKNEKSMKALKLLDYMLSESGARLITMGIEGVTYNMGENGFAEYIDVNGSNDINVLEEKYGLYISGLYKRFHRQSGYFNFSEKEKEAQDMMLNKEDGFWPEDPVLSFTEEEKAVITEKQAGIKKAAEEFATKYILSDETGDAAWESWLKKAETLGVPEVEAAYNSAQERYDNL